MMTEKAMSAGAPNGSMKPRPYPLPDATGDHVPETARLNSQHEMFRYMLGGLHVASLPESINYALDMGCGTGVWSREFAAEHPEATVLAVDLNPPKPDASDPQNVTFTKANVEDEWSFSTQPYDFVFARLLISAVKDWPGLFKRIHQHLAPGGTFESYEGIITMRADDPDANLNNSAIIRWYDAVTRVFRDRGIDPDAPLRFGDMAKAAGFWSVEQKFIQMYLDPERAMQHDPKQSMQVSAKLRSDIDDLLNFLTEGLFSTSTTPTLSEMRQLAQDAREDISQNAGPKGYYVYHTLIVAKKA